MVNGDYLDTPAHSQLGLSVVCAALAQLASGFFRPHTSAAPHQRSVIRILWEYFHLWFGRIIMILSCVTIFFGLNQYGASNAFYIAYGVVAGVLLIIFIILEIRQRVQESKQSKGKGADEAWNLHNHPLDDDL